MTSSDIKLEYNRFRKVFNISNVLMTEYLMAEDYEGLAEFMVYRKNSDVGITLLMDQERSEGEPVTFSFNFVKIDDRTKKYARMVSSWAQRLTNLCPDTGVYVNFDATSSLPVAIEFDDPFAAYNLLGTPKISGKKLAPEFEAVLPMIVKIYALVYVKGFSIDGYPNSSARPDELFAILEQTGPMAIENYFRQMVSQLDSLNDTFADMFMVTHCVERFIDDRVDLLSVVAQKTLVGQMRHSLYEGTGVECDTIESLAEFVRDQDSDLDTYYVDCLEKSLSPAIVVSLSASCGQLRDMLDETYNFFDDDEDEDEDADSEEIVIECDDEDEGYDEDEKPTCSHDHSQEQEEHELDRNLREYIEQEAKSIRLALIHQFDVSLEHLAYLTDTEAAELLAHFSQHSEDDDEPQQG